MKCDVCGTKIPLGSRECPNCGYKYGTSHVNTYDASGNNHEHIQVKPKRVRYQPKQVRRVSQQQSGNIIKIFLVIFIISVMIGTIVPAMMAIFRNGIFENHESREDMTIQEALDEGYDDNGVLALALEQRDELVSFADESLNLTDIYVSEYVSTDYGIYASYTVSGYRDVGHYSISVSFDEMGLDSVTLSLYNSSLESIRTSNAIEKEKDIMNYLGAYYDQKNLFDRVLYASHQLQKDSQEENRWVYNNHDDSSIYLSENYYEDGEEPYYDYYCRVDIYE